MKVAAVLAGEPRFCREFDLFLEALSPDVEVDWFMMFWNNSQAGGTHGFELISNNWLSPQPDSARALIEANLPPGHRLISLELADRHSVQTPQISNRAGETNAERMWGMYNSIRRADQLRRDHEAQCGMYDLVIRARPDVGVTGSIDLKALAARSHQNVIFTPNSEVHGYGHRINDMMAVGSSAAMTVYMNAVEWIPEYHSRGLIFHPETMLSYHCSTQGLTVESCDWGSVVLRKLGRIAPDGTYFSDFGRWA